MVKEIKRFFMGTTVTALAIGITGCGSTSDAASADASGAKEIKVVLCSGQAPYAYEDENGNPAGFDYEVLKKIDEKGGAAIAFAIENRISVCYNING